MATPEAPKQPKATGFFSRLEALRGIAALTVAGFHSWQSTWLDADGQLHSFLSAPQGDTWRGAAGLALRILGNGYGAVIIFFVLSGFALSASLLRNGKKNAFLYFVVARLFRIYPAIFAMIIVFAIVYWSLGVALENPDSYHASGLLLNALLLDTKMNGVTWSLQVEVLAIPIIYFSNAVYVRFGVPGLLALVAFLTAVSFGGTFNHTIEGPPLVPFAYAFAAGVAAFHIARPLIERCDGRRLSILVALSAVGFMASRPLFGWASHWAAVSEVLCASVLVTVLASDGLGSEGRCLTCGRRASTGRFHTASIFCTRLLCWSCGTAVVSSGPSFASAFRRS